MLSRGIACLLALAAGLCFLVAPAQAALQVEVQSPSAILIDAATGRVLFEKNADEPREPASVTKAMTLALALQAVAEGKISLQDQVTASAHAASLGGAQIYLEAGETMSFKDLLYGVAVGSGNDASVAVAEHVSGSEAAFVEEMNQLAERLGMKATHFLNPHGLPAEGHRTTARDMAILGRYIVNEVPEVLAFTSTWEYYLRGGSFWLVNTNQGLKRYPGMDGIKTGWTTSAGYNLLATAERQGTRLVTVVMGGHSTRERDADIYRLLDAGLQAYRTVQVARRGEVLARLPVHKGLAPDVAAVLERDLAVTVERSQARDVRREVTVRPAATAPVKEGQVVGEVRALLGGEVLARAPLVAQRAVPKAPPWILFSRYLLDIFPW